MATKTEDDATRSVAADVQEKGSEVVAAARDQVGSLAGEAREDAAFRISEEVDRRSTEVGRQVGSFGRAVRSSAEELRNDGKTQVATFAEGVAQRIEELGDYLERTDGRRVLDDVEAFARRRPWLTASAAAIGGFVTSRFVKASSERRYEGGSGAYSADPTPARGAVR